LAFTNSTKQKNNQPTQKMFHPQTSSVEKQPTIAAGKPPHPLLSSKNMNVQSTSSAMATGLSNGNSRAK